MARNDYLTHLASVPLFASCSKKELEEISRLAVETSFAPGKQFIRQGDFGHELVIIIEGTASVIRDGRKVATVGPGDFVGEMAVLQSQKRNASIVADTELHVLVIDQRVLDTLLDDIPGMARRLLKVVALRCAEPDLA